MAPDDLPRSPTGRVPRWVEDEAAVRRPHGEADGPARRGPSWAPQGPDRPTWTPEGSHSPTPTWTPESTAPPSAVWTTQDSTPPAGTWTPEPTRRRSLLTRLAVVVVIALAGLWAATTVLPQYLREADAPFLDGVVTGRVPEPSPDVAQLAEEMRLTDAGRDLFYMSEPELLGAEEFAGRCDRGDLEATGGGAVGCYHSAGGIESGGRIAIYTPEDERLRGFVITTAAHELLHAAWMELTADERTTATAALETALRGVDPADPVHEQLAGSVGGSPESRPTELFAYIGTQVSPPDGLDPGLETLYARYFTDRQVIVAAHTGFRELIDTVTADVTAAQQRLAEQQYEQARGTAQLEADTSTLAQYRSTIEQEEARLAGLPASERARSLLSWTWRDGTPLPEAPAAELLADARELLARDEAELATRSAALQATAAEISAEETRVQQLRADVEALYAQLNPTAG